MSLDKSLVSKDALVRHRNVLTRTERIEKLMDEGKWDPEKDDVFGLPKVRNIQVVKKKKKKEEAEEGAEGDVAEGEAAPAAAKKEE